MNRYPETLFPTGQHPARQPKRRKGRLPANVVRFPVGLKAASPVHPGDTAARRQVEEATLGNLQRANAAPGPLSKRDQAILEAFQIANRMNSVTLCIWVEVGLALAAQHGGAA